MYVHHSGLYCILFLRFLISKINIAWQLTKLLLKKVTTTTTTSIVNLLLDRHGVYFQRIILPIRIRTVGSFRFLNIDQICWNLTSVVTASIPVKEIDKYLKKIMANEYFR